MPTQGPSPSPPQGQRATGWWFMPFSFETFAWAISALFQLLAVCAYLLSFPDVDGVDDQLPDMPEVIQDSAIEMKITYSVFTRRSVSSWCWRKKMEEPDNSLMVMVGARTPICNHDGAVEPRVVAENQRPALIGPPFFLASVFLVGIALSPGVSSVTLGRHFWCCARRSVLA